MRFLFAYDLEILEIFGGVGVRNAHFVNASFIAFIEIQYYARRNFFWLDDPGIIQTQVERIRSLVPVQFHRLSLIQGIHRKHRSAF